MFATSVDHIAVTVSDLDRSLAFYQGILGLREVERHLLEGAGIEQMTGKPGTVLQVVRLAAPDTPRVLIDLQQYLAPKGKQSDSKLGDVANAHFCFGVRNLRETFDTLRSRGVDFVSEPVRFELESGPCYVVFLRDPDGFILELLDVPA
jgi:catechol 2,3-dioxygenase-like lactoylglutathione lyase family enzyme